MDQHKLPFDKKIDVILNKISIFEMEKTVFFRIIDSFGMKYTVNIYQRRFYVGGLENIFEYVREKRVLTTGESLMCVGNVLYKIYGQDILIKKVDTCFEIKNGLEILSILIKF